MLREYSKKDLKVISVMFHNRRYLFHFTSKHHFFNLAISLPSESSNLPHVFNTLSKSNIEDLATYRPVNTGYILLLRLTEPELDF